ncbi:hypothetical protein J437_LFUL017787 [Ladona fulva]|uniref:DNA-directed DNA polymerase n=1 Tax=Ladona fulva TaxID=123851 RepID=A0A8K0KR23_LADFU|nr:hypothetical protein J437_LFUL017787 [Ladona fulva]
MIAKSNLEAHGLLGKSTTLVPEVSSLCLPVLKGGTIETHFYEIGEEQTKFYRVLLQHLVKFNLPKAPFKWSRRSGWTKYGSDAEMESVDFPDEDAVVFDVEVCRSVGDGPTMATAVSSTNWYSWVCWWLSEDGGNGDPGPPRKGRPITLDELIPLESKPSDSFPKHLSRKRIVVAHHASYDRARVKEQYWPNGSGLRFFDTLSAHVCVGGVSSYQRAVLTMDERRRKKSKGAVSSTDGENSISEVDLNDKAWREVASLNSLGEAHRLHCGGPGLDKSARSAFDIDYPASEILPRFQELMTYCSNDAKATHELLCALLPQFLERFPHPVTLAGMLELGTARLPVSHAIWNQYLSDSSRTHDELESELKLKLIQRANEACRLMENGEEAYKRDLWMWDQDWSTKDLVLKQKKGSKELKSNEPPLMDLNNFFNVEDGEPVSELEEKLFKKFSSLLHTFKELPSRLPYMPGYPKWYRKLCPKPTCPDPDEDDEWIPGPTLLTTNTRIAPKLLRLCWEKYPVHYVQGQGWGILIPGRPIANHSDTDLKNKVQPPLKELLDFSPIPRSVKSSFRLNNTKMNLAKVHDMVEEYMSIKEWTMTKRSYGKKNDDLPEWYKGSGLLCADVDFPGIWFCRIPHREGPGNCVGNPLSKDFLDAASDDTMSVHDHTEEGLTAKSALTFGKMISYWRNNRERVSSQMVVCIPCKGKSRKGKSDIAFILPQVIVSGTLTRRAVEPTWMTASNAESDRVGSELRAIIRPHENQYMVGADVDSQELWIAALLGDAADANMKGSLNGGGMHGGTPLGWRTLQGNKSEGTDMHSATAAAVGCTRDQAKVLNYARIYGAGRRFATRLLQKFSPHLTAAEASKKADTMMELTKGRRVRQKEELGNVMNPQTEDNYIWEGGSESAMFNALEKIAKMPFPETPFLRARLSRALEPERIGNRFLPTRINWVVQSGAVDFLHLLLVAIRSLSPGVPVDANVQSSLKKKFDLHFALSFHDEVRYIVPESGRYEAALRLHVAHLLVRAFCASRVGLFDLPMSVAFFGGVSVDRTMRKEPYDQCVTPSNPHGLHLGHGVPPGESLDIYSAFEKADGKYTLAPTQKLGNRKIKKRKGKD